MIRKLRIQFITIASIAVFLVLTGFMVVFNSARYIQSNNEVNTIMQILSDNAGTLPSKNKLDFSLSNSSLSSTRLSQMHYFTLLIDSKGTLIESNMQQASDVATDDLDDLIDKADVKNKVTYFKYQQHYYAYLAEPLSNQKTRIIYLDITDYIEERPELLILSIYMFIFSMLFFIVVISIFSGQAIRPYIENAERQKRFITNAGHELKTPLAIISANTELQEMLDGESEWSKSTKDQVQRMTDLINRMVTLAKLEEQADVVLSKCDFSAITQDAAEDFKGPVIKDGKQFTLSITPGLFVEAEEKSLFELVTILVDNANKYCDPAGQVIVSLSRLGRKKIKLEVSNTFSDGKAVDYSKFFERFYRQDESHNQQVSGYGIGLSMAESLVKLFKGRIGVTYKNNHISFRVIFPSSNP